MTNLKLRRNSAFTLVQTVVALIIIGAMAGLMLPRYGVSVETVRSREAVGILTAILAAQHRYALDNSGNFTNSISNLDVSIPTPQNFGAPTVLAAGASGDTAAQISRSGGSYGAYQLSITRGGTITCSGGTGNICTKIGY